MMEKFDQIVTRLQQRIMRKERLTVTENGTYTAPENTGYTVVDVNVATSAQDLRTVEPVTITENGVTTVPDDKVFSPITVEVTPSPINESIRLKKQDLEYNMDELYVTKEVTIPEGTIYVWGRLLSPKVIDSNGIYKFDNELTTDIGYGELNVNVPNNITFERFTGRYSKSTKNFSSAVTNEAVVSNAVMDVDTLPRTDDMHNTSFLAVFYGKITAPVITSINCVMEVTLMNNSLELQTLEWDVPFKMSHISEALSDGKYAYMAQFGLRLSAYYPDGVPENITAIRLNKIYTRVTTSGAMSVDAGSVTTITALTNT